MSAARARISPAQVRQPPLQQAHHRWTDADIATLEVIYPTMPAWQVGERLGRTAQAVRNKAHQLAMRHVLPAELSAAEVAQVLGRQVKTVHRWLVSGRLKGKRDARDEWHVRQVDLRTFASTHPAEVNRERADIVWLLRVMGGKSA